MMQMGESYIGKLMKIYLHVVMIIVKCELALLEWTHRSIILDLCAAEGTLSKMNTATSGTGVLSPDSSRSKA